MAASSGQLYTYHVVGEKIDMSEMIANISPDETPLFNLFSGSETAKATSHRWIEDALLASRRQL